VLSSGFDVVMSSNGQSPLSQPVILSLDNSVTTQLQVKLQAVANAKAYQVQYCNGAPNAGWQEAGIFPSTRGMFPFHYVVLCERPDLELDPRNLITLCIHHENEHHVLLGHLDDYESYNPDVLAFVKNYSGLTSQQIRADQLWQKAVAGRPKHFD
jgi:hypothetical protein